MRVYGRLPLPDRGKPVDQIAKLDEKEKDNKDVLKKHDLRADTLKTIAKETEKDKM